ARPHRGMRRWIPEQRRKRALPRSRQADVPRRVAGDGARGAARDGNVHRAPWWRETSGDNRCYPRWPDGCGDRLAPRDRRRGRLIADGSLRIVHTALAASGGGRDREAETVQTNRAAPGYSDVGNTAAQNGNVAVGAGIRGAGGTRGDRRAAAPGGGGE